MKWYATCPWKASWIPDMAWAVFSQNCSRVVCRDRKSVKKVPELRDVPVLTPDTYLVGAEGVGQHVAAAGSQHVHLLAHIILQLLKLALCASHLGLDLTTET